MNKNWGRLFYSHILQRGKEYYKSGKVKGFIQKKDSCMARVLGTHIYNVAIKGIDKDYPEMQCSCAYAKGGENCKHEAAVLYYLENQTKSENNSDYKFKTAAGNTYFNIERVIEDYDIDSEDIEEARDLILSGNLVLDKVNTMYIRSYKGEELAIEFFGKLSGNRSYPVDVRAFFTKDRMMTTDCYAEHKSNRYYGYYAYDYLCEHKLALLLLADDYIAKFNPGDATDFRGDQILKSYRKIAAIQKIDDETPKSKTVHLEPRLIINTGKNAVYPLSISFKVGMEKLYILRNIPELINAKETSGGYKLSKSAMISFMDNDFDDDSINLYRIIEKAKANADYLSDKMSNSRYYYSKSDFQFKEKVDLSPDILDSFYDASCGKKIELVGGRKTSGVKLVDGRIKIYVHIRKLSEENGDFAGLFVSASLPVVMKGKSYDYILDEDRSVFSRITDTSPIVKSLMSNADETGDLYFTIGKKNLSEFYYRLLPELMDCPEIEVVENPSGGYEKFLPPECQITYYLDANEDNIIGKATAKYDDEEIELHQLRDEDFPLPESRDIDFEQNAVKTVMKYLPEQFSGENTFYCEKSGDNTFELLSEGLKELMAVGEVKTSKDFERLKIRKAPTIRLGISVESGILNLDVSTDDMTEDELLDLLESYRKKKKFFRLKNGEFIRLETDDTLEELTATMQAMGISAKEFTKGKLHLPAYRAIYINKLLEEHDEIASDRDSNFKSLVRNFNSVKESDVEVPESLAKVLRGYQTYGFKWLSMLSDLGFGGILADDMGLGKTLQVITLLLSRSQMAKKEKKKIKSLIVCPASLVYNWEEEFKRFAPKIDVKTVTGTQSERKKLLSSKKLPEVLVTSYDLLKRDIGFYEGLSFDFEIIDEAQFIKNASAAASKSVKVINAVHRFALTGTPIENRLSELWSIFDYLMPGFLYTYDRFKSDFETAITKYKDEEVTKQLKNMVGPFILRRLKENVLKDLPEKMEEIRFSRFDPVQRKLYDAQVTHMKRVLESEDYKSGKDRLKVLAELTKIRQICCDPELITAGYKGESAKRVSCLELVQSAIDGGHKILLFSQFTSMFELLEKDFKAEGIEFYKITGQTPKEERIKLVHAFNENEVPLFLISLKAGGTGLNLTGADVVIHYDPWWNLAAQNQATDRAHRIGQTKKVSVFKLIAKDTIEEKIIEMQNAKKDLADAILSGESESLMNLSKEQLIELLG
ncbi:Superfamily II DNA or RNA helicase, SNF2 family [Butyrivibrio sp. Su6]|uniref:DEAD/DEAH box helicase n=1 Tax=Butyrivibrio sp. Su6 TaxID=1520810 RepID=UPI00089F70F6|nr:DEAD/DEAH box helicase [Butyrivibrio sp. Su6]SEG45302.1 Superfamily II DNA or RNA helicase, SNF2 family [Butyrivibrio sp. Su6]